jgi:non-haem Fe2+, alpha-ketoglutarate-dependent halogenase
MLSDAQVASFQANGFLTGIRTVDPPQADQYREMFDALEGREGLESCRIGLLDRHFDQPFIQEIASNPVILDCVERLIGPDILLLATHFFCKYGQDAAWVAWHQDVTYWGLQPPEAITAWYAIDAADCENGCMRVLPGTHRAGVREHGTASGQGNLLSVNQQVPVTPEEESRAVDLVLKAGEISLHDGALIHGSLPNRSTRRRCGLTLRYIPTSVGPAISGPDGSVRRWNAVLVRGEDRYHHFSPEE